MRLETATASRLSTIAKWTVFALFLAYMFAPIFSGPKGEQFFVAAVLLNTFGVFLPSTESWFKNQRFPYISLCRDVTFWQVFLLITWLSITKAHLQDVTNAALVTAFSAGFAGILWKFIRRRPTEPVA